MSKQDYVTAEEIIESHTKYGDDFMVIDINKARPNDAKNPLVYYINVNFKSTRSKELKRPVIKLLNLTTASSIKAPTERKYEPLKISLRKVDTNNEESKFGKAMEIVCNTFKKKVKQMVDKKLISDDSDDLNSKVFPSVKPQTPLQTTAKDKDGKTVKLENPMYWINMNNKRYSAEELKMLPNMKDMQYPNAYVKDFDVSIYDIEKPGERTKFALASDENDKTLDNSNVNEFLKSGSIISGSIMLQCIVSKNSFNLNTRLYKSLYVKKSNYNSNADDGFDDDDMEGMLSFSSKLNMDENKEVKPAAKPAAEVEEEISDDEESEEESEDEE
jgi:hypothetical protein